MDAPTCHCTAPSGDSQSVSCRPVHLSPNVLAPCLIVLPCSARSSPARFPPLHRDMHACRRTTHIFRFSLLCNFLFRCVWAAPKYWDRVSLGAHGNTQHCWVTKEVGQLWIPLAIQLCHHCRSAEVKACWEGGQFRLFSKLGWKKYECGGLWFVCVTTCVLVNLGWLRTSDLMCLWKGVRDSH